MPEGRRYRPSGIFFAVMWERSIKLKLFAVVARGEGANEEKENIRTACDGVMTFDGERIEIHYEELMGEQGLSRNTLSFLTADRNVVTLIREGVFSSVMTFSENDRYHGVYHADFASFDFTVATRDVKNKITFEKGGTLLLDYNTEIQGVPVQTSLFRFEIICEGQTVESSKRIKRPRKIR